MPLLLMYNLHMQNSSSFLCTIWLFWKYTCIINTPELYRAFSLLLENSFLPLLSQFPSPSHKTAMYLISIISSIAWIYLLQNSMEIESCGIVFCVRLFSFNIIFLKSIYLVYISCYFKLMSGTPYNTNRLYWYFCFCYIKMHLLFTGHLKYLQCLYMIVPLHSGKCLKFIFLSSNSVFNFAI